MSSPQILMFEDVMSASAWNPSSSEQFQNAGAKLTTTRVTLKLAGDVFTDEKAMRMVLTASLKDFVMALARVRADFGPSSEWDKNMVNITASYTDQVGSSADAAVDHNGHTAFVRALEKASKFLKGKALSKVDSAFSNATTITALKSQVAAAFPPGLLSKKKVAGEKIAHPDIAPLVAAMVTIGLGGSQTNIVRVYALMVRALAHLTAGDAHNAFNLFDEAFNAALNSTKK